MKWIVGVLLSVLLLFLANSVFTKSSSSVPQSDRERMIAHGSLDPVANEMEDYPDVRDAAIAHHGRKATLVLVVDQKTDGVRAEELGNRFIERIESHVETSFPPGCRRRGHLFRLPHCDFKCQIRGHSER